MIKNYQREDKEKINEFLKENYYQITEKTFIENPYRHYIFLEEKEIKGVLIYDEIYERFELIYIYIEEKSRHLGYGNLLMKHFLEIVKNKQGENITLEVDVTNKNAIALYKKHGFEKVAVREKYYENHNGYLMIRKM